VGQHRSTQRKIPCGRSDEDALTEAIKRLAEPVIGRERTAQAVALVMELDDVTNILALMAAVH